MPPPDPYAAPAPVISRWIADRQRLLAPRGRGRPASAEAYARAVAANRARWAAAVGVRRSPWLRPGVA